MINVILLEKISKLGNIGEIVKVKDPIEYLKRLEFHKNSKNHEDYFF